MHKKEGKLFKKIIRKYPKSIIKVSWISFKSKLNGLIIIKKVLWSLKRQSLKSKISSFIKHKRCNGQSTNCETGTSQLNKIKV